MNVQQYNLDRRTAGRGPMPSQPPCLFHLFTLLALFAALVPARDVDGQPFPRDGQAGSSSMLPQWEINYYADDYKPVCGASFEREGDLYWSNSPECEPAMAAFERSAAQVQNYDTAGVESQSAIGGGTLLCLCFAVEFTPRPGRGLDICLLVGAAGQVVIRDGVGAGIQSPEAKASKLLPQCELNSPDGTGQGPSSPADPGTNSEDVATSTAGGNVATLSTVGTIGAAVGVLAVAFGTMFLLVL